jgi:uncharacterized protein involved in cysteine biosynthesis
MVFFSALGVLAALYALHFRRRALAMGPERLLAALSRTVTGDEEEQAGEEALRQGISDLEARLRRAFRIIAASFVAILAACLVLIATSILPELGLALSGVCVFLASLLVAVVLLRDIPRTISRQLDGSGPGD